MRRLLVVLITLFAGGPSAAAAPPAWVVSGPDGGAMRFLARSPTNPAVVFAVGDTVWKSSDAGAHWAPYGPRMVRVFISDMVVGPGPVDDVVIAGNGSLFRSVGGGEWKQETDIVNHPVDTIGQAPASPARLVTVVAASGSIGGGGYCAAIWTRRSTDAGHTWAPRVEIGRRCSTPSLPVGAYQGAGITASPTDPQSFWIVAWGDVTALWRTRDGGRTWTPETVPLDVRRLTVPAPGDELVAATSSGATFHRPVAGGDWLGGMPTSCATIVPEPFVLATTLTGCAGTIGPAAEALLPRAGAASALAAAFPGVLRQSDAGWQPSVAGMDAQLVNAATRLGDGSVVLAAGTGLYRQATGGPWDAWGQGLPGFVPATGGGVSAGSVVTDAQGRALVTATGRLWRRAATDAQWTEVAVPAGTGPFAGVTAVPRMPTAGHPLYVSNGDGVFASDDSGATWPRFAALPAAVVFDPATSTPDRTYASQYDGTTSTTRLFVTGNRGASWQALPSPPGGFKTIVTLGVDPADANHLVALATVLVAFEISDQNGNLGSMTEYEPTVIVSHDGGHTWGLRFRRIVPEATAFAFDRDAPGVIYAGSFWDGLWASADDGVTWGQVPGPSRDQAVTSFLPENAPAAPPAAARAAAPWRLYATIGRVHSGFARVDARVRLPRLRGKAHHNGRRTGRVATCTGASLIGGGRSLTIWLAGRSKIGTGRRFKLPPSAVGRAVRCEFRADTPYANVFRRSPAVTLVGAPYTRRPLLVGGRHVGARAICRATWRGKPAAVKYTWRVGGAVRGTGAEYVTRSADAGRGLSCTAAGRNRYGTYSATSIRRTVRR